MGVIAALNDADSPQEAGRDIGVHITKITDEPAKDPALEFIAEGGDGSPLAP